MVRVGSQFLRGFREAVCPKHPDTRTYGRKPKRRPWESLCMADGTLDCHDGFRQSRSRWQTNGETSWPRSRKPEKRRKPKLGKEKRLPACATGSRKKGEKGRGVDAARDQRGTHRNDRRRRRCKRWCKQARKRLTYRVFYGPQNPVWATMCGFNSHLRYFNQNKDLGLVSSPFSLRGSWVVLPEVLPTVAAWLAHSSEPISSADNDT